MHNQISHLPYLLMNNHAGKGVSPFKVQAEAYIQENSLCINFIVESLSNDYKWQLGENWSDQYYKNWQLWETDVVEFYLQMRSQPIDIKAPYYEFQINPANKSFALKTIKPREVIWTPIDLGFTTNNEVDHDLWKASMQLDMSDFIDSNKVPHELYGNFHACLGEPSSRTYWSAFHIENPVADFHRPEQFQQIKTIKLESL